MTVTALITFSTGWRVWRSSQALKATDHGLMPENLRPTSFERAGLNARIQFIYHVTIQKPGAEAAGWERLSEAQALLPKLRAQGASNPAMPDLAGTTSDLERIFERYRVELQRVLSLVRSGTKEGPEYDRAMKEWAAQGNAPVNATAVLNRLTESKATEAFDREQAAPPERDGAPQLRNGPRG